jgi:hypothetical protein
MNHQSSGEPATAAALGNSDPDLWARSMERVKEDRGGTGNVAIEIPAQLRHYDDRRWFLATQVAEVRKHNLQSAQDFVDLAAMIKSGEMISLPAVTETYLLYGVGARVDGAPFTRYVANQNLELNDEAGLREAFARLESAHAKLRKEISDLQAQSGKQESAATTKQEELENEIAARQQELKSTDREKARLNQYFAGSGERQPKLLRDYESLQKLAENFGGRSFNLDDASDRQAFKVYLLSSLRPQALRVLEEIAKSYEDKFERPLPVSSLVRPEQYQHALRRVNRYAVLIDTPPHSTGLAFDIDYRFMSGAEQNFVMNELARLKDEGRIEVLRERGANYHVFAFIDGHRPNDELINASLDDAGTRPKKADPTEQPPVRATRVKSRTSKKKR